MLLPLPSRLLAISLALAGVAEARAEFQIVATLPDLAAIAREIAGTAARVTSLARGTEDPHFVDPRPSFIRLLNRADLLIDGGAGLEAGWLSPLVQAARNPRIQKGASGRFTAAEGLRLLDVPSGSVDRSQGDVHPEGNPHFLLSPDNCRTVATRLAATLGRLDPTQSAFYETNLLRFEERLTRKADSWRIALAGARGTRVVTYHTSFNYLLDYFGFELAGTIEPKPGIEPSPAHIQGLVARLRQEPARLVLIESNRPRKTAEQVSAALNARLVALTLLPGGHEDASDFFAWFDFNVTRLGKALEP